MIRGKLSRISYNNRSGECSTACVSIFVLLILYNCTVLCHAIPYHTIPYHTIPCFVPYHAEYEIPLVLSFSPIVNLILIGDHKQLPCFSKIGKQDQKRNLHNHSRYLVTVCMRVSLVFVWACLWSFW